MLLLFHLDSQRAQRPGHQGSPKDPSDQVVGNCASVQGPQPARLQAPPPPVLGGRVGVSPLVRDRQRSLEGEAEADSLSHST